MAHNVRGGKAKKNKGMGSPSKINISKAPPSMDKGAPKKSKKKKKPIKGALDESY